MAYYQIEDREASSGRRQTIASALVAVAVGICVGLAWSHSPAVGQLYVAPTTTRPINVITRSPVPVVMGRAAAPYGTAEVQMVDQNSRTAALTPSYAAIEPMVVSEPYLLGVCGVALAGAIFALWRKVSVPQAGPPPMAMMSTTGESGSENKLSRRNLLAGAGALGLVANKIAVEGPAVYTPAPGTLTGRTILITGGNHGLGFESAVRLAKGGAQVVITARTPEKAEEAIAALKAQSGSDNVSALVLDLADLQSVKACAEAYMQQYGKLDVLMNNAGVMAIPERETTKDGFEKQFGINHLGHFALTAQLQPALKAAAVGGQWGRVINVSSSASYGSDAKAFDFDAPGGIMAPEKYTQWGAYCQSKLANVLFTKELNERYKASQIPITSVALHPGAVRTELARYLVAGKDQLLAETQLGIGTYLTLPIGVYFTKDVDRGANTQIWLAAGADGNGSYQGNGGEFMQNLKPMVPNPVSNDKAIRSRLWTESEKLTGTEFKV